MSGNVIDINKFLNKDNSLDELSSEEIAAEVAERVMEEIVSILYDCGFDIDDDMLMDDLIVFHELLIASVHRFEGIQDKNIHILDNCLNKLKQD